MPYPEECVFNLESFDINQKAAQALAYVNFLSRNAAEVEEYLDVILHLKEMHEHLAQDNIYDPTCFYYDPHNDHSCREHLRSINSLLFSIEAREANVDRYLRPYADPACNTYLK